MAVLLHGTTRQRTERIEATGPDPDFVEPGGMSPAESFSACLEAGPFPLGTPEQYALRKAALFPTEGGAAILAVDVPDDIIAHAAGPLFPLGQGVVQFDVGAGLEELQARWPALWKEVRPVRSP
jgi:hypothetical protein